MGQDEDSIGDGAPNFRREILEIFWDSQRLRTVVEPVAAHELEVPPEDGIHIPPTRPRDLDDLVYWGQPRHRDPVKLPHDDEPLPVPAARHVDSAVDVVESRSDGLRSEGESATPANNLSVVELNSDSRPSPRTPATIVAEVLQLAKDEHSHVVIFAVQMAGLGIHEYDPDQKTILLIEMGRAYLALGDIPHAVRCAQKASKYIVHATPERRRDLNKLGEMIRLREGDGGIA